MNELMACFGKGSWVYWKTDETNCIWAIEELDNVMTNNGINTDNLKVTRAVLRDENENDIDEYEIKE